MTFPAAIEITLLGGRGATTGPGSRSAYQRRVKLAREKTIRDLMAMTAGDLEIILQDVLEIVEETAGTQARRSWPISRQFTGAKRRRFVKKPGEPHSVDEFYFDAQKTRAGIYGALKNRAPYAAAIEKGAFYKRTGFKRKPRGALRRVTNDHVRRRTNTERYKRIYAKARESALRAEMREAQRREQFRKTAS